MALVITALVDATPYRLRYLATQDGGIASPSDPEVDAMAIIPNAAGATPDLKTDIDTVTGNAGAGGIPLQKLIDLNRSGDFGVTVGAMTLAQVRAFLNSDDAAGASLTNLRVPRAVCIVTPRTGQNVAWAVDATRRTDAPVTPTVPADPSVDPILIVRSSTGTLSTAYVDIHFRNTEDL